MAKRRAREEKEEEEEEEEETKNKSAEEYEQYRAQRIKENMDRMQKLGLLNLLKKLKPENPRPKVSDKPPSPKKKPSSDDPPRRSSRLGTVAPVNYSERREPNLGEKYSKNVEICIAEGENPEVYTKEHVKLLGDYKNIWTLNQDGCDEDGQRIYDSDNGKSCHQCRQKTICKHTECSKCKSIRGQFCGDCLFMRYGENVIEANENPFWICPVCRDICNCSRCRREKGWVPTGCIHKKVLRIGYKSVAHYLILTRLEKDKEDENSGDAVAVSMELVNHRSEIIEEHNQADDEEQTGSEYGDDNSDVDYSE